MLDAVGGSNQWSGSRVVSDVAAVQQSVADDENGQKRDFHAGAICAVARMVRRSRGMGDGSGSMERGRGIYGGGGMVGT